MGAEHRRDDVALPLRRPHGPLPARHRARRTIADLADQPRRVLRADPEVYADPEKYYDQVIEIDLDTLEPHLVGPHTPDLARPVSAMAAEASPSTTTRTRSPPR
jgi:aconitase A